MDILLYEYACQLLDGAIRAEGPGFREDLDLFRSLRGAATGRAAPAIGTAR